MLVKNYGIYDQVLKGYTRTFTSQSDEVAERAAKYIVREPHFDKVAGVDLSIHYLFTLDSETGAVVDNQVHFVCTLAAALAEYELEKVARKEIENVETKPNPGKGKGKK